MFPAPEEILKKVDLRPSEEYPMHGKPDHLKTRPARDRDPSENRHLRYLIQNLAVSGRRTGWANFRSPEKNEKAGKGNGTMKAPQYTGSAAGFNMTPMIDVVFLLIIFFLVASHFTNQENAVEVDLPKAENGNELPQDEMNRLTLSVPQSGELFIGVKQIALEELSALLLKEKTHRNERSEPFQLRIRAGRSVPYSEVEPILLAAAEAGIADVQFAVMEE